MIAYVLGFMMLFQSAAAPAPKDEISESLKQARELYYDAKYTESVQVLLRVNDLLQSRSDRLQDKVDVKLQLALANIGLNDIDKAKSYLIQMYTLDPNAALDANQYSPKVMTLATEAKTELVRIRCQAIEDDARNNLKDGNAAAIARLVGSPDAKCVNMAAISAEASDLLYKSGLEAYKNSEYPNALLNFQAALKFSPKHELANQYIELTQGRLQVALDRLLIEFQKNFEAHKLPEAAANFKQLAAFNASNNNSQALRQASDQYRKTLTELVDSWNRTCAIGNTEAMNELLGQITELLPDPTFGEDIRAKMNPCTIPETRIADARPPAPITEPKTLRVDPKSEIKAPPKPDAKVSSMVGRTGPCLQIDYRVAMARLKSKVDPDIPREARPIIQSSQVTVRVKVRIDEEGTISSSEIKAGNPILNNPVRNAVDQWKFSPAMDINGIRCVDTEIPIVIGPLTSR